MVEFERLQRICGDGEERPRKEMMSLELEPDQLNVHHNAQRDNCHPTLLYDIQNPGTSEETFSQRSLP